MNLTIHNPYRHSQALLYSEYEYSQNDRDTYNSQPMTIGERLEKIRVAKGLSRPQVAKALNSTEMTIYRLERGSIQISDSWLQKFAKVYDCRPADFYEDNKKMALKKSPLELDSELAIEAYDLVSRELPKLLKKSISTQQIKDVTIKVLEVMKNNHNHFLGLSLIKYVWDSNFADKD